MSKIMIITTLTLKSENLLDEWKALSAKIDQDLAGADGFISRDVVRKEDGTIYCILKWESTEQQVKFMAALAARDDIVSNMMMEDFANIVDVANMTKESFEVL